MIAIYILGSGGFANEISTYIHEINPGRFETFYVDDSQSGAISFEEYKYMTSLARPFFSIMGSGQCHVKKRMAKQIVSPFMTIKHNESNISPTANIEDGSVVAPGAVIAANVNIGKHCLTNYNCTVGHDTLVGDYSVIGPNASIGGFCKLGEAVYVGAGAHIRETISIGDNAVIGMGAVITKDVPPNVTIINVNEIMK